MHRKKYTSGSIVSYIKLDTLHGFYSVWLSPGATGVNILIREINISPSAMYLTEKDKVDGD